MLRIKRSDLNIIENLKNRILTEAVDIIGFCGENDPWVSIYDVATNNRITFSYNPVGGNGYWPLDTFGINKCEKSMFDTLSTVEGQSEFFGVDAEDIDIPVEMKFEAILSSLQTLLEYVVANQASKKLEIIED